MEVADMPKSDEKCICCHCGETQDISQFYTSFSNFFLNGHLPICKKCFQSKFDQYNVTYHSTKKAMQRLCMAFDIYYDDSILDSCGDDETKIVGKYFRKFNMPQYRGKTFEETIECGNTIALSGDRLKPVEKRVAVVDQYGNEHEDTINPKDVERWGIGLEVDDYKALNAHYKYLKNANPNIDSNAEIFIADLCYINMQKMKALRENRIDDYNKLTESYRKSFSAAGLKTVQEGMKTSDDCWSTFVGIVSQYTPEEYYRNKDRYKDHDGLGEYYERMAIRPLRNLELGTNDRDAEFYVHEEDEADD
jgi:hypothetical protein